MPERPQMAPRFGVRLTDGPGIVTHWAGAPLVTYEQAEQCLAAIRGFSMGDGEIEKLLISLPAGVTHRA